MRFQRSIKLFHGVRINLSKSGVGVSAGVKGFRAGIDARGRKYVNVSAPGTGLSHRQYFGSASAPTRIAQPMPLSICHLCGAQLANAVNFCPGCGSDIKRQEPARPIVPATAIPVPAVRPSAVEPVVDKTQPWKLAFLFSLVTCVALVVALSARSPEPSQDQVRNVLDRDQQSRFQKAAAAAVSALPAGSAVLDEPGPVAESYEVHLHRITRGVQGVAFSCIVRGGVADCPAVDKTKKTAPKK